MIDQLINTHKVIVCVGCGGVGKTTVSACLAIRAAQLGKKTLVLTIDPSRRLATALGIDFSNSSIVRVPHQNFPGELFASVLDSKKVFDEFIIKNSTSETETQKLFSNILYRQLSTKLSGSQEFTALELLFSLSNSEKYDLIVLDTPPAQHAIEFLAAPKRLYQLFDESVIKWFSLAGKNSFFNVASRALKSVFNTLEKLTGNSFIEELSQFFSALSQWQKILREHTVSIHNLLTGPHCCFILVTGFDEIKLKESISFQRDLKKGGYSLEAIIINRAFPEWLPAKNLIHQGEEQMNMQKSLYDYYLNLKSYLNECMRQYEELESKVPGVLIQKIPDFHFEVCSLLTLEKVTQYLIKKSY